MSIPTILILQGGGSLGAYECGVYQELAPSLENLSIVAGTSIGAINAGLIAKNYHLEDRGVSKLTDFWTNVLARPSTPFLPFPGVWQRWNALLTTALWGNPQMFLPRHDSIFSVSSSTTPSLCSFKPLEQTLASHFGRYDRKSPGPRLILTAVDIELGEQQTFDSWEQEITPEHIAASGSLPPGFPSKKIKGRSYWDGGLWSNTPLSEVFKVLQEDSTEERLPIYRVYIVDVFPKEGPVPDTFLGVQKRINELRFADKTTYDAHVYSWINRYLDLIRILQRRASELPNDLVHQIDQEFQHLKEVHKQAILNITPIKRSSLPNEEVSGGLDFSPEWIEALMHQGRRDARQAHHQARERAQKRERAAENIFELSQVWRH